MPPETSRKEAKIPRAQKDCARLLKGKMGRRGHVWPTATVTPALWLLLPCVLIKFHGGAGVTTPILQMGRRLRDRNNFSSSQIGLRLNHAKRSPGPQAGLIIPLPRGGLSAGPKGHLQVKQRLKSKLSWRGLRLGARQSGVVIKKDEVVKLRGQHHI